MEGSNSVEDLGVIIHFSFEFGVHIHDVSPSQDGLRRERSRVRITRLSQRVGTWRYSQRAGSRAVSDAGREL